MQTRADAKQPQHKRPENKAGIQKGLESASPPPVFDQRPEAIAQRQRQELANSSSHTKQLMAHQKIADNSPQAQKLAQLQTEIRGNTLRNAVPNETNNPGLSNPEKTPITSDHAPVQMVGKTIQRAIIVAERPYRTLNEVKMLMASDPTIGWDPRWKQQVELILESDLPFSTAKELETLLEQREGQFIQSLLADMGIPWQEEWNPGLAILMKFPRYMYELQRASNPAIFARLLIRGLATRWGHGDEAEESSGGESGEEERALGTEAGVHGHEAEAAAGAAGASAEVAPALAEDSHRQGKLLISLVGSQVLLVNNNLGTLLRAMLGSASGSAFVSTSLLNAPGTGGVISFYQQRRLGFLVDGGAAETGSAIVGIGSKDLQVPAKYKRLPPTDQLRADIRKHLKYHPTKTLDKLQRGMRMKRGTFEYNEVYVELSPRGIIGLVAVTTGRERVAGDLNAMQVAFMRITGVTLPKFVFNKEDKSLTRMR